MTAAAAAMVPPLPLRRQYAIDVAEAEQLRLATLGEWVYNEEAGYLYNAAQRHYYDPDTGGCTAAGVHGNVHAWRGGWGGGTMGRERWGG